SWVFPVHTVVAAGPIGDSGLLAHVSAAFPCIDKAEFIFRVEIMIDARIELIAIRVVSIRAGEIVAVNPSSESNAGRIQTITHGVVVWLGHACQQRFFDEARRVVSRPQWIPTENTELLKITGGACRAHRIAIAINHRVELRYILVVRAREETKDS